MTHDELRALLAGYAAGALDDVGAGAVRAHLASGCLECVRDVFARPVGRPAQERATPGIEAVIARPPGPRWRLVPAVALALAVLGSVAWDLAGRRGLRADAARLHARLAEMERARAAMAVRLEGVQARLAAAEAGLGRQAAAARAAAEEAATVRRELTDAEEHIAALTRDLGRRKAEVRRLLNATTARVALQELFASPGTELLRLDPAAPFRDVRGHVVWHPLSETVVVFAFGLPVGRQYRVRARGDDGTEDVSPSFRTGARGDAMVSMGLRGAAGRLATLEVVLDPFAEPVLAGRRAAATR